MTFIVGILLANTIHSIGPSPNQIPQTSSSASPTSGIGYRIHETPSIPHQTVVRNLLSPDEIFSTVDHVRFVETKLDGEENAKSAIGSFRLPTKLDNFTSNESQSFYSKNATTSSEANRKNDYDEEFLYDEIEDDKNVGVIDTRSGRENNNNNNNNYQRNAYRTNNGNNNGNRNPQPPSFVPQGYQEDRYDFAEHILPNQKPFQAEDFRRESRSGRTLAFPGEETGSDQSVENKPRLKSIVNIETSLPVQQQSPVQAPNLFTSTEFTGEPKQAIQRQSQFPNPYFPPKSYEIFSEYPGPPKQPIFPPQGGSNQYWRSRSPRVVFPDSTLGSSPYSNDNVVFRWVYAVMVF